MSVGGVIGGAIGVVNGTLAVSDEILSGLKTVEFVDGVSVTLSTNYFQMSLTGEAYFFPAMTQALRSGGPEIHMIPSTTGEWGDNSTPPNWDLYAYFEASPDSVTYYSAEPFNVSASVPGLGSYTYKVGL